MIKRIVKYGAIGVAVLLFAAIALAVQTWYFKPLSINWFYPRVFLKFMLSNPEMLTRMRLLEGVGIRGHNARLTDASPAFDDKMAAQVRDDLATLKSYDAGAYTGQDRLSYDVLNYFLDLQVRGERWRFHDYPVNQMFGVQSNVPNLLAQTQQINDATDARHYIARLDQFPTKFGQVIESLKLRESKGVVPPAFVVTKVIEQMRGFVAGTGGGGVKVNVLYTSFDEKLGKLPADKLDAAARQSLLADAERAVKDSVLPAYGRLIDYMETLRAKATRNDGVWALPDGDAFYRYKVEENTTTTMSPDEIHALGLAEVERIGAEIDTILRAAGYREGTIGARIVALSAEPAQLYPADDAGRAQMLRDYQAIIDEISAGLDSQFSLRPKATVVVKRIPEFAEKTAPGAYYEPPPFDGSAPGTFFANLRDPHENPKFSMRTLAYHEAVPGHHFQIAIAQEIPGLPIFRRVLPFTAYAEGWALYAERVAWEMGFEKNPLDNLGRLRDEMFRAVRLVVDTGLHAKRWTREQAIDYMAEHTGMGAKDVEAEIERYLVDPGQALAYKVGMIKILALREKAKKELGERFDIRAFHAEMIKYGALPLALLERVNDEYIARVKGAVAAK